MAHIIYSDTRYGTAAGRSVSLAGHVWQNTQRGLFYISVQVSVRLNGKTLLTDVEEVKGVGYITARDAQKALSDWFFDNTAPAETVAVRAA